MELKGKKIAFLGDSITEGAGVSDKSNIFWNILGQQTGAQVYGYGIGGTRIARQHKPSACAQWDLDFISRVDSMIDDADIVVVFGGTNDFGHGDAPFGVMSDRTNDTFYGALHVLYQKLCQRYPSAQIVVMTPTHRSSEDEIGLNEQGVRRAGKLADYAEAIRQVAEVYSIPVLDLFRVSGIQPKIPAQKELFMPDGLHPNDAGHRRIAQKLMGFLNTL